MKQLEIVTIVLLLMQKCKGGPNRSISDIIESLLHNKVYDHRTRPFANDGKPVQIYVDVNINEISSVNEVNMEYSMTCFIRQAWVDKRLLYTDDYKSIPLNYNYFDDIWTPDLYVENAKSAYLHTVTVPNRHIRIRPDGRIFFSQRLTMTVVCDMVLDRYPMDNQTCFFDFSSYSYTTEDMIFYWNEQQLPIELNKGFSLPEYEITGTSYGTCNASYITGSFSCLRGYFYLKRRLKAFVLGTYLPSLLVVLLSWLSFWIDPESTPARTSLSILTILTITTQSSSMAMGSPAGSFTKASDFWMATCLVFVFAAFIEYSIVNTLSRNHKKHESANLDSHEDQSISKQGKGKKIMNALKKFMREHLSSDPAMAVEIASRFIFPFLFIIFNIIYWSYYLVNFYK